MRKLKKIAMIMVAIVIVCSITFSNSVSLAYNMMATINNQAGAAGDPNVTKSVMNISGSVITIVRVVCAGVAIIMLLVLAMKYMSSAPGEKADIKKHAVVYIVGAVIMFGCTGILGILQKFGASF